MRKDLIKTKFPGIYYSIDSKTKVKTYIARIKINGLINTEQIVGYSNDEIRTNPTVAYQKRNEIILQLKSGKPLNKKLSLRTVFDEYIEYVSRTQRDSTIKTKVYYFNKHFKRFERKLLTDIKTNDIQKFVNELLKKGYKPQTAKHLRNLLKAIFNYAIKKRYLDINPANNIELPKFNNERKFYLPTEKAKELYHKILEIPDNKYRLMFLFLLRGRRKGEVLSLEWQDVNFESMKYVIRDKNNKIGEEQTYLLDDELIEHFKYLEQEERGLIFKSNITGKKMSDFPRHLWKRIKDTLGIKMRIHDFRHLLGLTLINNGIPIEVVSRAMGHKSIKTTQRYSNMKEEMAKVGTDAFLNLLK
jgi:integrase